MITALQLRINSKEGFGIRTKISELELMLQDAYDKQETEVRLGFGSSEGQRAVQVELKAVKEYFESLGYSVHLIPHTEGTVEIVLRA